MKSHWDQKATTMKKILLVSLYFISTLDLAIPYFFDAPPAPLINSDNGIDDTNAYSMQAWWNRHLSHRYSGRDDIFLQPVRGNLMIGREDQLSATSTCGLIEETSYCIKSYSYDGDEKQCFRCDSRNQSSNTSLLSHRVESLIGSAHGAQKRSWWQSENGIENVSIRLDLESKFEFTNAIMVFKSIRPAAMLIEASSDFGNTWKVLKYFAEDCKGSFPEAVYNNISCESRYSNIAPESLGQIYYHHFTRGFFRSEDTPDFTTNLRFNFTKTFDWDQKYSYEAKPNTSFYYYKPIVTHNTAKESNYYAIYELMIRGSVDCNGHASRLVPKNPGHSNSTPSGKVNGKCFCRHNTKGNYCEECDDMHNDLPWKAATYKNYFSCKKCECNNHATSCHFDPAVYEASGQFSGGVCDYCQHNTMGKNCEQCKTGYSVSEGKTISDVDACRPI